jgi:hypothetical protein
MVTIAIEQEVAVSGPAPEQESNAQIGENQAPHDRVVITWPNKYGGDSAPTEGWSDGSQNCLHDMRIVGNT